MIERIDRDGDLMTIDEFEEAVMWGAFIDDDGFGYFADEDLDTMDTETDVLPSDVGKEEYEDVKHDWTHIVWFNR